MAAEASSCSAFSGIPPLRDVLCAADPHSPAAVVEAVGSTPDVESFFQRMGKFGSWPNVFDLGRALGLMAGLAENGVPSLDASAVVLLDGGDAPLKGPHCEEEEELEAASSPPAADSEMAEKESVIECSI